MKDLKNRTIRGGFAKLCGQAANFTLRIGSLMVLGRLLEPKDFGLVGMVTAVIGVFNLFKEFGLSTATVQRTEVTEDQISTLFWINMLVGAILATLSVALAPVVASFYHEPRLYWVTVALASGFLFNAAGVQHSAILQREMRFVALAIIDITSLVASITVGIGMAIAGYKYWSIVGMTITAPAVSATFVWLVTAWIPNGPRRRTGIRSLLRFGGTITLNGLIVYVAYNLEKVLLGRFWGADSIGVYGRAYQLITIPTDNFNSAIGGVAIASLSRLQNDAERLRNYFLKAYSLALGLTLPITLTCALFAHDVIAVILGPKWQAAAVIFRLLAPTTLILAMINPFFWLLCSLGLIGRSLKIALVLAPLVIGGYLMGLPYGPKGVAAAYSIVMTLWVVPHIVWCVHGTVVSLRDVARVVSRPLFSALVAAAVGWGVQLGTGHLVPLARLVAGCGLTVSAYLVMLIWVMGQKAFYQDLLKRLAGRATDSSERLVSAEAVS